MNHVALSNASKIAIDSGHFYSLENPRRIAVELSIGLTDHSYSPKDKDLRSDWVATVATPSFKVLRDEGISARHFCTIGTGAGLDALAAIEILESSNVFVTDIHNDVVIQAIRNIAANVDCTAVSIGGAVGDLIDPVADKGFKADVLYENLPNIPMTGAVKLLTGQNSSTFIVDRAEPLPEFVTKNLIALHYVTINNAHRVVRSGGRVLSSIGGRIPIKAIQQLSSDLGLDGRIILYTWKQQSEAADVIGGYAEWEAAGYGPFAFYPLEILEEIFEKYPPAKSGCEATTIELLLEPHKLSAEKALREHRQGRLIGHTVAVLETIIK